MLIVVDLAVAIALLTLAFHWGVERLRLRHFVATQGPLSEDPTQRALELAGRISNRYCRLSDPFYLSSILSPFGATPSAVIRHGGCCSGASRLYILCLSVLGLRANQITVYHRAGHAQHCLVEVHVPDGKLIADPVYGIYYTDDAGRVLSLEDLQEGVPVTCRSTPGTMQSGYPSNPYYDFDYTLTKTANWTMSWQRRLAYAVLWPLTSGSVDRMRLPVILEWPQALLGIVLLGLTLLVHAGAALHASLA
jgi:hypothetical protein